jgi:hypothetical protein
MTKTIYMDESGFTGANLLDTQQSFFVVESADVPQDQAEQILKASFPSYQGNEFKFQNIWKSSRGRKGLVNFATHLNELGDNTFTWMTDKKLAVLTKIVDFLIEPIIHKTGYNFYADGFCWKYTNYIYYGFNEFASPDVLESIINSYQRFSRNPSAQELGKLQGFLRSLAERIDSEITIFLEQMALGAELFTNFHDLSIFKGTDDLQFTTMLAVVGHWRQRHNEDFIIIHDASSNFSRQNDMWEKITNNNVPKQNHQLGDGTFVEFPLRVVETHSVDSKDNCSVQFCDVLAGLAAKCFGMGRQDEHRSLMDKVIEAGLKEVTFNGVRFQPIFPDEIPPPRLEGADIVDQMAEIIFGAHNNTE